MDTLNNRAAPSKLLAPYDNKKFQDTLKKRIQIAFNKLAERESTRAIQAVENGIKDKIGRSDLEEIIHKVAEKCYSKVEGAYEKYTDRLEFCANDFWTDIREILLKQFKESNQEKGVWERSSANLGTQLLQTELADSNKQSGLVELMMLKRRHENHIRQENMIFLNHREWFEAPFVDPEPRKLTSESLMITLGDEETLRELQESKTEDIDELLRQIGASKQTSGWGIRGEFQDLREHNTAELKFPMRWDKGILGFRRDPTRKADYLLTFFELAPRNIKKIVDLYLLPAGASPQALVLLKNKDTSDCILIATKSPGDDPTCWSLRVSYLFEPEAKTASAPAGPWQRQDLFEVAISRLADFQIKALASNDRHVGMLLLPEELVVFIYPSARDEKLLYGTVDKSAAHSYLFEEDTRLLALVAVPTVQRGKQAVFIQTSEQTQPEWTLAEYSLQTYSTKGKLTSVRVALDAQQTELGDARLKAIKQEDFEFRDLELDWRLIGLGKFPAMRVFVGVGLYPPPDAHGKIRVLNFNFELTITDSSSYRKQITQVKFLKIIPKNLPSPEFVSIMFHSKGKLQSSHTKDAVLYPVAGSAICLTNTGLLFEFQFSIDPTSEELPLKVTQEVEPQRLSSPESYSLASSFNWVPLGPAPALDKNEAPNQAQSLSTSGQVLWVSKDSDQQNGSEENVRNYLVVAAMQKQKPDD